MRQPIRLVLFDLGSTLMYEQRSWDSLFARADVALWQVLRKHGVKLQPSDIYGDSQTLLEVYNKAHRAEQNSLSEPTTIAVLDELLRSKGFALSKEQLQEALRAMYSITQTNWLPEEDALPALNELKRRGYRIGLISNAADDENTQTLIDKGNLRPYLEYIISSAKFGRRKPDRSIFEAALSYFGIPAEQAVMVGDSFAADIVGAHRAGMQGIWITRRTRETADRAERPAEAVVKALAEVPGVLEEG
jgi:HAD superfamily hydrolase (TIGR01509 family)